MAADRLNLGSLRDRGGRVLGTLRDAIAWAGRRAAHAGARLRLLLSRAGGAMRRVAARLQPRLASWGSALVQTGPVARWKARFERLARRLAEGRFLRWASYGLLGFVSFCFFLYQGLPYSDLAERTVERMEAHLPVGIRFDGVHPWLLTGARIDRLEVTRKIGPDRLTVATIEDFRARLLLLPLLRGVLAVRTVGHPLGGEAQGEVREGRNSLDVAIAAHDLSLERSEYLRRMLPLPPHGVLSGTLKVALDRGQPWLGKGEADLQLKQAGFDAGTVFGVFKVPAFSLQTVAGKLVMNTGKVDVGPIALSGGELDGDIKGIVTLQPELARSAVNLRAHLKPSDRIFALLSSGLPLLGLIRDPQGYIGFSILGTLTQPNLSP